MLLGSWQLKTTVFILLLASCLGQELLRNCERNYCYEQRSIERRISQPNDLREEYRYQCERLQRKKDVVFSNHEENRDNDLNSSLPKYTRRENTRFNELRQRTPTSDVTRHLGDRAEERLERDNSKRREANNELESLRHLDDHKSQHDEIPQQVRFVEREDRNDVSRRSDDYQHMTELLDDNGRERRLNLRQVIQRDISASQRIDEQFSRMKRELKKSYNVNRNQKEGRHETLRQIEDITNESENNIEEGSDISRNMDTHKIQREINRRSDVIQESGRIHERNSALNRRENKRQQRDYSYATSTRLNKREYLRLINSRLENIREEHSETLRILDDRESRETLRQLVERESQREVSRRSNDARKPQSLDKRLYLVEQDSTQRLNKNKRERVEAQSQHRDERLYNRERKPIEQRDDMVAQIDGRIVRRDIPRRLGNIREERRETLKTFDTFETQREISKRSDDTRISLRVEEHRSERERQQPLNRQENVRVKLENRETQNRIDGRESQRGVSRRSDDARKLQNSDDRLSLIEKDSVQRLNENKGERVESESQRREEGLSQRQSKPTEQRGDTLGQHEVRRDILGRLGNSREDSRETFNSREALQEVSKRSDDNRTSQRIEEHRAEQERQLPLRRQESMRKKLENRETQRRIDGRESQRDVSRRSDKARKLQNSDERFSLIEKDSVQRLNENKLERIECESQRREEKLSQRQSKPTEQRGDTLGQHEVRRDILGRLGNSREDSRETFNSRETLREVSKRSDGTRTSQRIEEHRSEKERQLPLHRQESMREKLESRETKRRIDGRVPQRDVTKRLDEAQNLHNSEERLSLIEREPIQRLNSNKGGRIEYEFQRREERLSQSERKPTEQRDDILWRLENGREERRVIFKILDGREIQQKVSKRSDDTRESQQIGDHISQKERKFTIRRDENKREQSERHISELELSRQTDNTRKSRNSDARIPQKEREARREFSYETPRNLNRRQVQQVLSRHNTDELQYIEKRSNRESSIRRNENEGERIERFISLNRFDDRENQYILGNLESLHNGERISPKKQESTDRHILHFIKDDYMRKSSVLLKNIYIVFGQGVLLAFVIIKTLNSKDELKNHFPRKLHQAVEMIGF